MCPLGSYTASIRIGYTQRVYREVIQTGYIRQGIQADYIRQGIQTGNTEIIQAVNTDMLCKEGYTGWLYRQDI